MASDSSLSRRVTRKYLGVTKHGGGETRRDLQMTIAKKLHRQHFAMMLASDLFVGYMRSSMAS